MILPTHGELRRLTPYTPARRFNALCMLLDVQQHDEDDLQATPGTFLMLLLADWLAAPYATRMDELTQRNALPPFKHELQKCAEVYASAPDDRKFPNLVMVMDQRFVIMDRHTTERASEGRTLCYDLDRLAWQQELPHHPVTSIGCDTTALLRRAERRVEIMRERAHADQSADAEPPPAAAPATDQ